MIIFIGDLDRAVLGTGSTTPAFIFNNVSGLFNQGYLEVSGFPFYPVNISIGQDFYIGVPAAFNKLRRFNAQRAVIGGEGFIKLGHLAADSRRTID
ncbi:hypothetical protein ES708_25950 [subsurface metagenome]